MKKRTLSIIAFSAIFAASTLVSCGGGEATEEAAPEQVVTEEPAEEAPAVEEEVVAEVLPGEELFKSSGCVACHQVDTKLVGPALQAIAEAYADNQAGMVSFLKEEADAIVDPTQFAVMQANLAITKAMPEEDLNAIAEYILSTK